MATLKIHDLTQCQTLDTQTMGTIRGGFLWGWIVPYGPRAPGPAPVTNLMQINQYFADQLQIINQTQIVEVANSTDVQVNLGQDAATQLP